MDDTKPPATEPLFPPALAEVPDEIPAGLLEPDGSFMPDYDPPPRPFGVWVASALAAAAAFYSAGRMLSAVSGADMVGFLINGGAAWAYGFSALGLFRGDPRGHTTYIVLLLVNLVFFSAFTVLCALIASNTMPQLLSLLGDDPGWQEFVRNAALAMLAASAAVLGGVGLLLTWLESDRVREWVGKDAG
ncbi:MAG: hypothetical protein KIT79_00215 [Deltaproteobacteria bacterium]|nr:hypothetical protein [Deltaproteobacteria bacterium]